MKFIFKCFNHEEKTNSLLVDVKKGEYYCFSCSKSGSIYENKDVLKMLINHLKKITKYFGEYLKDNS